LSVAPPVPSPLSNLASRAAFRDLSEAIVAAYDNISPRVASVRLEEAKPPARGRGAGQEAESVVSRLAPALRVRADLALVYVPRDFRVARVAGVAAEEVAADDDRGISLVRVPVVSDPRLADVVEGFAGFSFVIEVTATETGPSVQPIFIGRTGAREDSRWPSGVVAADHPTVPEGAFLFTLEGRLLGLVIRDAATASVVPPSAIEDAVTDLLAAAGAGS
jgi:hypothetical protein